MDGGISRTTFDGAAPAGAPPTQPITFGNRLRSGSPETDVDAEIDTDIVVRVRHGQREAFDDLYDRYADDVFSVCLLILGEPTVAHAAAGTAFALVARSRLSPLSDPTRLHSWLLELARGSSLAWSGSPQVQAALVPHGVSPKEMLAATQLVAAPATLREGLSRTFDRAAMAATARNATAATARNATAATTGNAAVGPDRPPADAGPDGGRTLVMGKVARRDAQPGPADTPTVVPLVRSHPHGRILSGSRHWPSRPIVAVAASLIIAVVGVVAIASWPTAASNTNARRPDTAVVTPGSSGESGASSVGPSPASGSSTAIDSTVAGRSTQQPSAQRTEPAASDLGLPDEVALVSSQLSLTGMAPPTNVVGSPAPPVHASPGTTMTPPRPTVTTTPPEPAPTVTTAPTASAGSPGTQPPTGSPPTPGGTSTTNPSISTTSANAPALGVTEDEGVSSAKPATVSGPLTPV